MNSARATRRLAWRGLSARPTRTGLLVGAVALSAALIVTVACALSAATAAINGQLSATIGGADARVKPASEAAPLGASVLERVRSWPEVSRAEPRLEVTVALSFRAVGLRENAQGLWARDSVTLVSTAVASALAPGAAEDGLSPPPRLLSGRLPAGADEIVIDAQLAARLVPAGARERKRDGFQLPGTVDEGPLRDPPARLEVPGVAGAEEARRINATRGVRVGDQVEAVRQLVPQVDVPLGGLFQKRTALKVVGIAAQPPLGGRPRAYVTMAGAVGLSGQREARFGQIDVKVREGVTPDELVARRAGDLPAGTLLQTSERVTSGLDRNVQSSRLGMILAMVMGAIAGAFIIMTGLTTAATERQRELAILRCVGGTRGQLAATQVWTGVMLGVIGAGVGVPLGVLIAWGLIEAFKRQLPMGLVVEPSALLLGAGCALLAGVLGAVYPAWRAGRTSPLSALASRAETPRRRGVWLMTAAGVACLLVQAAVVGLPSDGQVVFWAYATLGLPVMYTGYFLLGVPAVLVVSKLASGALSRALGLPSRLLGRTVSATPYRHGLTAGALMGGLALMVAIWVNGGAILRDWVGKIEFPDAFVSGLNISEEAHAQLRRMTGVVADTCAVTLHAVETDAFGVRALQKYTTTFVGFEPGPFFRMTRLTWVEGDEKTALARLEAGGAVIVAREFRAAQGLGVGDRFRCTHEGRAHEFEIVGVVASPGLELVSKFFNVGENLEDQSLHAVFGSRDDMKARFFAGQPAPIQMIQVRLTEAARRDDEAALARIREELIGAGILDAGSGRQIKELITGLARGGLLAMSAIGAAGMLVASLGVANVVVASVEARRFEMGVLRAVGATRGVLVRLVLGEAVIIALAACALGLLLGVQGAWAGRRLHGMLLGIEYALRVPVGAVAVAAGILVVLTLLAAGPAAWRVGRARPRELLGGMKG